jgi:hypothetical protein
MHKNVYADRVNVVELSVAMPILTMMTMAMKQPMIQ